MGQPTLGPLTWHKLALKSAARKPLSGETQAWVHLLTEPVPQPQVPLEQQTGSPAAAQDMPEAPWIAQGPGLGCF